MACRLRGKHCNLGMPTMVLMVGCVFWAKCAPGNHLDSASPASGSHQRSTSRSKNAICHLPSGMSVTVSRRDAITAIMLAKSHLQKRIVYPNTLCAHVLQNAMPRSNAVDEPNKAIQPMPNNDIIAPHKRPPASPTPTPNPKHKLHIHIPKVASDPVGQ